MSVDRYRVAVAPAMLAFLIAFGTDQVIAQVPFPSAALVNAPSQQAALIALGANQAELSGHLFLDAPEIALPGKFKARGQSQLPGTSQMVLLRVTLASQANPGLRERPFVAGGRIVPGKPANIETEIDAASTLNLVLLAQTRGKWFYVMREVKIGRSVSTTP